MNQRGEVTDPYDGPTALKAAIDYRPDVVLLDIGLPELNGFEVAKQMRQQPALRDTVLVAVGQATDRQRSKEAGFDHYLGKPADLGEVQRILASVQVRL